MCNQDSQRNYNDINDDTTESYIHNEGLCDYGILNSLTAKHINKLIIAHININSIRNKFEALKLFIKDKVHILLVSETKLDDSFPISQFLIEGYKTPIRLDKSSHSGGIMMYIAEGITSKLLEKMPSHENNEGVFVELNLRKSKWLLFGGYNPKKELISPYLKNVEDILNKYINYYDNIILMGDFNSDMHARKGNKNIFEFCENYSLKNIVKEATCFKNPNNPTCLDLILTNRKESFRKTEVIETGLSDFHKMTVACLNVYIKKLPPKIIYYRNYKKFNANIFRKNLLRDIQEIRGNDITYDTIKHITITQLNRHAPIKKKRLRANNAPFMSKTLRKAIMKRSRLKKHLYKISDSGKRKGV